MYLEINVKPWKERYILLTGHLLVKISAFSEDMVCLVYFIDTVRPTPSLKCFFLFVLFLFPCAILLVFGFDDIKRGGLFDI